FLSEVRQLAAQVIDDPTLLDYTQVAGLHSRHHYYDHHHLNQAGVEIFNPLLIQELQAYFPSVVDYSRSN
ncbi:MAG: hypothetical protein AAFR59_14730, partial [Bacteroidota bacterium]